MNHHFFRYLRDQVLEATADATKAVRTFGGCVTEDEHVFSSTLHSLRAAIAALEQAEVACLENMGPAQEPAGDYAQLPRNASSKGPPPVSAEVVEYSSRLADLVPQILNLLDDYATANGRPEDLGDTHAVAYNAALLASNLKNALAGRSAAAAADQPAANGSRPY